MSLNSFRVKFILPPYLGHVFDCLRDMSSLISWTELWLRGTLRGSKHLTKFCLYWQFKSHICCDGPGPYDFLFCIPLFRFFPVLPECSPAGRLYKLVLSKSLPPTWKAGACQALNLLLFGLIVFSWSFVHVTASSGKHWQFHSYPTLTLHHWRLTCLSYL